MCTPVAIQLTSKLKIELHKVGIKNMKLLLNNKINVLCENNPYTTMIMHKLSM
jgi:hypothetical protein